MTNYSDSRRCPRRGRSPHWRRWSAGLEKSGNPTSNSLSVNAGTSQMLPPPLSIEGYLEVFGGGIENPASKRIAGFRKVLQAIGHLQDTSRTEVRAHVALLRTPPCTPLKSQRAFRKCSFAHTRLTDYRLAPLCKIRSMEALVTLETIRAAAARIARIAVKTPLIEAAFPGLSGYGTKNESGSRQRAFSLSAHSRFAARPTRFCNSRQRKFAAASSPTPAATMRRPWPTRRERWAQRP